MDGRVVVGACVPCCVVEDDCGVCVTNFCVVVVGMIVIFFASRWIGKGVVLGVIAKGGVSEFVEAGTRAYYPGALTVNVCSGIFLMFAEEAWVGRGGGSSRVEWDGFSESVVSREGIKEEKALVVANVGWNGGENIRSVGYEVFARLWIYTFVCF